MYVWQAERGRPTSETPLMEMIWSPMLSCPHRAAGPFGSMLASTTVGTMEPQPDSTITTPRGSPFILGTITCNRRATIILQSGKQVKEELNTQQVQKNTNFNGTIQNMRTFLRQIYLFSKQRTDRSTMKNENRLLILFRSLALACQEVLKNASMKVT